MRLATALVAAALMVGVQAAHAAQYVGTITEIRSDGRTFTPDDGNVYKLQTNAPQSSKDILAHMKTGQKVRVTFETNARQRFVSVIQPAGAASDTGTAAAAGAAGAKQDTGGASGGMTAQQRNTQGVTCPESEVPTGHGSCVKKRGQD